MENTAGLTEGKLQKVTAVLTFLEPSMLMESLVEGNP